MEYSYRIVATEKIEEIQREISELMLNKWQIHGDLRVCVNRGKTLFVQAMINREIVADNLREADVTFNPRPSKEFLSLIERIRLGGEKDRPTFFVSS